MAPREEDKAMAGLLRRSLAQDTGAGSGEDCPGPEILAAYFDRALEARETARYDLHFSRCSLCREQLAAMARAGGVDAARKKTASAGNWLTEPRWLMPAAAALVALLVLTGIALRMRKPLPPTNEIAMARPGTVPLANSAPPANSAPALEASPSADVASKAPTDQFAVRPSAPTQHQAANAPIAPGESSASSSSAQQESSRAKSRAGTAARRDALSSVGAANTKSPELDILPRTMAPQRSPGMARGAMRAGNAGGAAGGAVGSANEIVTVTEAAPALDAAAAPAPAPAKKAEADTNESAVSASVQPDETKQPNAPKAKSAATASAAAPAQSAKAMNLATSRAAESAAFAQLQEAQISSNLMNLQIQTPDPKILWMIASAGAIEKSEDGGTTWKPEYLETRAPIVAGSAPTVKICWLVGANGTILRTTNGVRWKIVSPPAETDFVKVEATDALTATVTAIDGREFSTSDGGKSWNNVK